MRLVFISQRNVIIQWDCAGVSTSMAWSSPIPALETNQIAVNRMSIKIISISLTSICCFETGEFIKNAAASGITSDDEDGESEDDDSQEEGSTDRLLVF